MKILFSALFLLSIIGEAAHAGSAPVTDCVNVGNTIRLNRSSVVLLVGRYDKHGNEKEQFTEFSREALNVVPSESTPIADEKRGCTTRKVYVVKLTISLKDGKAMPAAYNRLAQADGTLNDYFLCTKSHAWMPTPGGKCD